MGDDGRKRARPTQVVVDLKGLRDPWVEWCKAKGMTPSEAVRRVLRAVLAGNPNTDTVPHPSDFGDEANDERRRVELRLSSAEYLAIVAAADREGLSVPKWLMALVRVHLTGEQMFGPSEVEALARSNQLLLALGRNINQIAYNMNSRVDKDELALGQIEFVSNFLKEHAGAVSALLHANSVRWRR